MLLTAAIWTINESQYCFFALLLKNILSNFQGIIRHVVSPVIQWSPNHSPPEVCFWMPISYLLHPRTSFFMQGEISCQAATTYCPSEAAPNRRLRYDWVPRKDAVGWNSKASPILNLLWLFLHTWSIPMCWSWVAPTIIDRLHLLTNKWFLPVLSSNSSIWSTWTMGQTYVQPKHLGTERGLLRL